MYTITGITIKVGATLGRALSAELHSVPRELWDTERDENDFLKSSTIYLE
jgi:hypothetical protein